MVAGIFRDRRNNRTVLQTQSSAQVSNEIQTEDQLRAAVGAAVDPDTGNSIGKAIVLASGTIPLLATLDLDGSSSGLIFVGQGSRLWAQGTFPAIRTTGVVTGLVFIGCGLWSNGATGSNACVELTGSTGGPTILFERCEFRGATYCVFGASTLSVGTEVSLVNCYDLTTGYSVSTNNSQLTGNRMRSITVTAGGRGNAIGFNTMLAGTITTSASTGQNTIVGNTRVATITPAGSDQVGLNT